MVHAAPHSAAGSKWHMHRHACMLECRVGRGRAAWRRCVPCLHVCMHERRAAAGDLSKERGAVLEEWRGTRDASGRMQEAYWKLALQGSKYAERLPIGEKGWGAGGWASAPCWRLLRSCADPPEGPSVQQGQGCAAGEQQVVNRLQHPCQPAGIPPPPSFTHTHTRVGRRPPTHALIHTWHV